VAGVAGVAAGAGAADKLGVVAAGGAAAGVAAGAGVAAKLGTAGVAAGAGVPPRPGPPLGAVGIDGIAGAVPGPVETEGGPPPAAGLGIPGPLDAGTPGIEVPVPPKIERPPKFIPGGASINLSTIDSKSSSVLPILLPIPLRFLSNSSNLSAIFTPVELILRAKLFN
jgi:hypothetical protein